MSLRARIGSYLSSVFYHNPQGIGLYKLEDLVSIMENRWYGIADDIVFGMDFKRKPLLETFNLTASRDDNSPFVSPFWTYNNGSYYLTERAEETYDFINYKDYLKDPEKISSTSDISSSEIQYIGRAGIIEFLRKKTSATFDELYAEFERISRIFKGDSLGTDLIQLLFSLAINFKPKSPYEAVYLDKMNSEEETNASFHYHTFRNWEFRDGLYFPDAKLMAEIKTADPKKLDERRREMWREAELTTAFRQIAFYSQLKQLTNSEFLREWIQFEAGLLSH